MLMFYLYHILLSLIALLSPNHFLLGPTTHLPPSTRLFQAQLLVSNSTVSNQVQLFVSHFHQTLLSQGTCLLSNCINLSTTAHAPPPPHPPKSDYSSLIQPYPCRPDWLSFIPTLSIQAQLLVYHLHHVLSSLIACLPLPPCQFRHNHS